MGGERKTVTFTWQGKTVGVNRRKDHALRGGKMVMYTSRAYKNFVDILSVGLFAYWAQNGIEPFGGKVNVELTCCLDKYIRGAPSWLVSYR